MKLTINYNSWSSPVDGTTSYYGGQPVIIDAAFLGNPDDFIDGKWNEGFTADLMTINMPCGYGKGTDFVFDSRSVDNDMGGVLADMCHYCEVHGINSDYLTEEEYQQALEDGNKPEWFCEVTYSDSHNWQSPEHRPDIQYYLPEETMASIRPQPTFDLDDYLVPEFQDILNNYMLAYKLWDFTEYYQELGSNRSDLAQEAGVSEETFASVSSAVDWYYDQLKSPDFRKSVYDYVNLDACGEGTIDDEIVDYMNKLYPELQQSETSLDAEAKDMSAAKENVNESHEDMGKEKEGR